MAKRTRAETKRAHLTERRIQAITPADRRTIIYDEQQKELGLKIEPTGGKTFFWFRAVAGRPTWKTIGRWPDINLDAARKKAQAHNVALAEWTADGQRGLNPFASARGELTLDRLVDAYCERHLSGHAKRPDNAVAWTRWAVKTYFADWRERKLSTIRRPDVTDRHAKLGEKHGHATANRQVQLLRRMVNFAIAAELYDGENPVSKNLKMYHEKKRTRFVQPDEMPKLFAALKTEPNPDVVDFVNLSLWTGARKNDVLSLRWQDASLDDNRWTVPDPKSRVEYVIALTPEAVKILKDRLRRRAAARKEAQEDNAPLEESPWVFPSFGRTGHIVDLKGRWKALLKRAGITNLRQHDLRRTLGSWQAGLGASLPIIGKSLGHSSLAATAIYSQLNLDPVRESVNAATQAMLAAGRKQLKAG
jgi:integrase